MKVVYEIRDWADNVMNFGEFDTFDDAEAYLSDKLGDSYYNDRQEYEIVEKN
jgi:hypothetical protein